MKNKLLLSSLLSLSILAFSGTAKAQESADATFTGTLSASTEVVKVQDGSVAINPTTGDLDGLLTPVLFSVTTSLSTGTDGRITFAPVSGSSTLALIDGTAFVALTNGTPTEAAIANAFSTSPSPENNPDVIVYQVLAGALNQGLFEFNDDALEGIILDEPGTNQVSVGFDSAARVGTFGPEDSAGDYTANLTLTAVGNL